MPNMADIHTYLPCDILATKVDVASMYYGLEVRTPLVDRHIFELAVACWQTLATAVTRAAEIQR